MRVASFVRVTALVAGALVARAPLASQDAPPRRLKLSDTGLPGIDLGLRRTPGSRPSAAARGCGSARRPLDRGSPGASW